MQQNLKDRGLYTGVIDGDVGPASLQGLAEYVTDGAAPDDIGRQLAKWLPIGNIEGRTLVTAFLAHAATESKLRPIAENLNYSVDGLIESFGRHRISIAEAQKYGRAPGRPANQEMIANIVYGGEWGRKNLGNTQPGDGWERRGMGIIQNTGRAAQREAGKRVGMDFEARPELLLTLEGAVAGAVGFWIWKGLNAICMQPGDTTEAETRAINGGFNGLEERRRNKTRLRQIWPY
ncbi:endolysin [Caulobacter phage Sansa]|uniref:Endolysin n=1 Tax=Caulobacter phage Sansa TaxID=1675600 RepID=A0A0K1LLX7_9CAUD|nr:endolysin [Caulobacter phage Sansa]AKU43454.1 endolysin [Caulobacter phage Sansa]